MAVAVAGIQQVAPGHLAGRVAHQVTAQMAPQVATVEPLVLIWLAVPARMGLTQRSEVE